MYDFAFTQETDGIEHLGVICQTQDIVIGQSGFLLCREVFKQISDCIASYLQTACGKGNARSCLWIYAGCVVDKVITKALGFDLFGAEIACELIKNGGNNFNMCKFFCT